VLHAVTLLATDARNVQLLDHLEASGELDNTIIVLVSDNGASGEGGPNGSVNENKVFNGIADSIEENLKLIDGLGLKGTRRGGAAISERHANFLVNDQGAKAPDVPMT